MSAQDPLHPEKKRFEQPGMLDLRSLEESVRQGEIETVLTVVPDLYGRLMGKRLNARYFIEHVAHGEMHLCDYLLACDMEMDPVPGYRFTSWETGYGDMRYVPDLSALRRASWLPKTALALGDLLSESDGAPIEVAPRRMLQRQLALAHDAGYTLLGGTELELYVFNETFDSARAKRYHDLQTSGAYVEDYHIFQTTKEDELLGAIRREMDRSGVPIESSKGEWGPGQQEINLEYCEALLQADRNVICKHAAREIAYQQNKAITFMAKWDEKLAGSGMHVHLSLWDTECKENLFVGDTQKGPLRASDRFRWFLGGLLRYASDIAACFAPYVASYKRFQAGSFAPTAIAWSRDNRTAGFRVVGRGRALRIECRVPGADANPYLVYTALIAAGLKGIQARIEPPALFEGDVYAARELPQIPHTLRDAILEFERSDFASEAFGEGVKEHLLHFLRTEQRKFDEVITDWEKFRFFERI